MVDVRHQRVKNTYPNWWFCFPIVWNTTWMHIDLSVKCQIPLLYFNQIWILMIDFRKNPQFQISQKSIRWEMCWYVRTDSQEVGVADVMKWIVPFFANYAKVPQNNSVRDKNWNIIYERTCVLTFKGHRAVQRPGIAWKVQVRENY